MTDATRLTSNTADNMAQTAFAAPVQAGWRSRWRLMLAGAIVIVISGSAALVWEKFRAGSPVRYVLPRHRLGP